MRPPSRALRLGEALFGPRQLVPNLVGVLLLLPVGFLVVMGLLLVDTGVLGLTNPAPVNATLDQIGGNSVKDGRLWVTVTGYLEPGSVDTHDHGLEHGRAYVIADPVGGRGVVVVSTEPLGKPGTEITITGFLWRGWHVWANGSAWNDWARSTYPSVHVMDDVVLTNDGPPGGGIAAVGLALLMAALLLVIGYARWRRRKLVS
jgi:hypothetical protein